MRPVLDDVSFAVAPGCCPAVLGPNASGKTTLLDTIGGLLHPQAGEVRIGGDARTVATAIVVTDLETPQQCRGRHLEWRRVCGLDA